MASSDTDDDVKSALIIAETLCQIRRMNVRKYKRNS